MPNRFTRIPDWPPPPLHGPVRLLVPVADAFMVLMISRPRTGSLRTAWVTPATLWLALALEVGGCLVGVFLIFTGSAARIAMGIVLVGAGLGAGAVAAVGLAQRRQSP